MAGLAGEVAIAGVERLTLAFLRSPADDRREGGVYGVPITYGCEALMRKLANTCASSAANTASPAPCSV